jgi:hypothetical protein
MSISNDVASISEHHFSFCDDDYSKIGGIYLE